MASGDVSDGRLWTRLPRRFWQSVFRGPVVPRSDQQRRWVVLNHLVLHFRPVRIPERTLRTTHTFGLGGMSLVLFLLLVSSGVLLMFAYQPSPERAYDSVVRLEHVILPGSLVRAIHYWSANFLIIVVFLHMLRVYFTGAFHGVRQFNWILGLGLLLCVVAANFTGYLLPWDQRAYWAITITTGMLQYVPLVGDELQRWARGGDEIGPATLTGFYTLHTTVVPVLVVGLMAFHFWRVRKAGGVVVPPPRRGESDLRVLFVPHLLQRETTVALLLAALVTVTAVLFSAPLDERANPGMSPNPAKAPWYFMGFQELLIHFHPVFAVVLLPAAALLALAALPYLKYDGGPCGRWFLSVRGLAMARVAAIGGVMATSAVVLGDAWISIPPVGDVPPWIMRGLAPAGLILGGLFGFHRWIGQRYGAFNDEVRQSIFVLLLTALVVLTVTGVFFRGTDMSLTWLGSG